MEKPKFKIDKEKIMNKMGELGEAAKKTIDVTSEKAKQVIDDTSEKAAEGTKYLGEQYEKAKHELDLKLYNPVFEDELQAYDFKLPFIIRIVKYDKRMENEACKGSIGFSDKIKQENILHIYEDFAEQLGITFYPCIKDTIFCANPYKENFYICLDDYFTYIRKAKVDELETIAHSLGAKYVKVSFKEKKKTFVSNNINAKAGYGKKVSIKAENNQVKDEYSGIEVAAEVEFNGNSEPVKPELVYFKNESDINALIKMRLDKENRNQIKSKTYVFSCHDNRGMQEKTAITIDAMLNKLGCAGNSSVVSEVQTECRTVLEYSIVFEE